jgi:hypothetical protein
VSELSKAWRTAVHGEIPVARNRGYGQAGAVTQTREDYVAAAAAAAQLLGDPAVAAAWDQPSALELYSVGGLAGHLAAQVLFVADFLADSAPEPQEKPVTLGEYYAHSTWIDAGIDDGPHVRIRASGDEIASDGPEALAARVNAALDDLRKALPARSDQPVRLPTWGAYSLRFDDFVTTRLMELVVHGDDLAVSVGLPTPPLPTTATDTVVDLLTRLAARRHGPTAVIRALSRAERAPASIAAF